MRIAELDPLQSLDHVDRLRAVRREVEVVGEGNVDLEPARPSGVDVDDCEVARALVVNVQRAHVPSRCDVVWYGPDREVVNHLKRQGVDHIDRPARAVRYVDPRRELAEGTG